jgi:hypothetical protein
MDNMSTVDTLWKKNFNATSLLYQNKGGAEDNILYKREMK